jgi:hypothetical protein
VFRITRVLHTLIDSYKLFHFLQSIILSDKKKKMRLPKLPKFNELSHLSNNKSYIMIKKLECIICLKSRPKSLFCKITTNCDHELNICKLCVNKHITVLLDKRVDVNCPFNDCEQIIQYGDMKEIANKKIFKRYDKMILYQALNRIPEFRWCLNAKCNFGQIYIEGGNNEFFLFKIYNVLYILINDILFLIRK